MERRASSQPAGLAERIDALEARLKAVEERLKQLEQWCPNCGSAMVRTTGIGAMGVQTTTMHCPHCGHVRGP